MLGLSLYTQKHVHTLGYNVEGVGHLCQQINNLFENRRKYMHLIKFGEMLEGNVWSYCGLNI